MGDVCAMDLQRGARVWMVTMTTIYADVSITLAVNVVRSAALVLFRRSGDQDMAMMHLFVNVGYLFVSFSKPLP